MKITVRIKPNAKQNKVEKTGDFEYSLWIKAPPIDGRANEAVIDSLKEYFGLPRSRISIIRGHKSRIKIIDIC